MSTGKAGLERARAWVPAVAGVLLACASGCSIADVRSAMQAMPLHEHNNYCGHAYLQDVHLDPTPRDFAGSDAWRGPLYENQIRWKDPWRGDRPVPERPMPWDVPGSGNDADRADPSVPTVESKGAAPHWPQPEVSPETGPEGRRPNPANFHD